MPVSTNFEIDATTNAHRAAFPYDFVIAMPPALAKEVGGKGVVISRSIGDAKQPLRVHANVLPDHELGDQQLRMDQTLRTALGIPFETGRHERDDLTLAPLALSWKQRLLRLVIHTLGTRYLFLRVAKPHPPDIEKNICRLPKDALNLMGTDEGNRIVLVSCVASGKGDYALRNFSSKAFDLSAPMAEQRDKETASQGRQDWRARYVPASDLLGVKPDISPIYLDLHARQLLGLEPGDPIKARRSLLDIFKQQLIDVGIMAAISAFAIADILPTHYREDSYPLFLAIVALGALLVTCLLIVLRLRSKVR